MWRLSASKWCRLFATLAKKAGVPPFSFDTNQSWSKLLARSFSYEFLLVLQEAWGASEFER